MHYRIGEPHGLPHNPFKGLVVPRPIGWISTLDAGGRVNLAPFSFYNAVTDDPPIVMFAPGGNHADTGYKDSVLNALATGEFVVNLATWDLRHEMNISSASVGRDVDEMALAGLKPAPSLVVKPPRVAAAKAALECVFREKIEFPTRRGDGVPTAVIFGEVVAIYIADDVLTDGKVDATKLRPISRLGYQDYAVVDSVFQMPRPTSLADAARMAAETASYGKAAGSE
jgi:flavin reductase (DIM6/NTAB) family NADH-FMN oxidoreductase RutF